MTDNEWRGIVLRRFYDLRHDVDMLQASHLRDLDSGEFKRLANICDQLAQTGLIEWNSVKTMGWINGTGKITAYGINVIEGKTKPPIAITIHDRSVRISGSTNVQVGSGNTLSANIDIRELERRIDASAATPAEKDEAKSLLEKVTTNPAFAAILGPLLTMLSGSGAN